MFGSLDQFGFCFCPRWQTRCKKKEVIRHNVVKKMIADLKLDEKQAADFRKVEAEFRDKMKAERKQADLDRRKMREKMMSLRDDRDAEMKKILTEDQYKQYLEKQRPQSPRKRHGRKE